MKRKPESDYLDTLRWIYFIQSPHEPRNIKIGQSSGLAKRMKTFSTHSAVPPDLLCAIRGYDCLEPALHELFGEERLHGEWFRPTPRLVAFATVLRERYSGHYVPGLILVELMQRAEAEGSADYHLMGRWYNKILKTDLSAGDAPRKSGYKLKDREFLQSVGIWVNSPRSNSVTEAKPRH